ncbi:hypothetical protein GCM10022399_23150 [Terrabacter ginsenosidimutans]|uniref:Uncharacterized protein n=1 Tax=Terrabacter ginsenosidimutans TaxID=490575 RepID=A0ABP7DHF6_9MICO
MERAPEVPVGGVEQPHATTVGPRTDTFTTDTPSAATVVAERAGVCREPALRTEGGLTAYGLGTLSRS